MSRVKDTGKWRKSKKRLSMHNLLVSIASEETPRLAGQSHTDRMKAIQAKVAAWKADPAAMVRRERAF